MSQLDDRLKSIRRQGPEFIPVGVGAIKPGERDYNSVSYPTYAAGDVA